MADTIKFNTTEAAEEYSSDVAKLGYPDDPYEIDIKDVEKAFIAGAQWAFDMIKEHGKGAYIVDIKNETEEIQ